MWFPMALLKGAIVPSSILVVVSYLTVYVVSHLGARGSQKERKRARRSARLTTAFRTLSLAILL